MVADLILELTMLTFPIISPMETGSSNQHFVLMICEGTLACTAIVSLLLLLQVFNHAELLVS